MDIRIGKVLDVSKVEGAEKLLLLKVDIGEKRINLVAGIAKKYSPQELVGKNIVVIANLEPAKIRGVTSEGMLLAADLEGEPVLISPLEDVPPGTKVI